MEDNKIREELVFQLTRGNAHMPFEEAVANFPIEHINDKFTNGDYTFWHLLEHIRRTQADILNFIINSEYKEMEWPKDYWPNEDEKATQKEWDETISKFLNDRDSLKKLTEDSNSKLFDKIPWGTGQTLLREILVVVDHNSYHLGEFSIMRQVIGAWPKDHK